MEMDQRKKSKRRNKEEKWRKADKKTFALAYPNIRKFSVNWSLELIFSQNFKFEELALILSREIINHFQWYEIKSNLKILKSKNVIFLANSIIKALAWKCQILEFSSLFLRIQLISIWNPEKILYKRQKEVLTIKLIGSFLVNCDHILILKWGLGYETGLRIRLEFTRIRIQLVFTVYG